MTRPGGARRRAGAGLGLLLLAVLLVGLERRRAWSEESPLATLDRDLRRAARQDVPLAGRLASLERALSTAQGGDADLWLRAGLATLEADGAAAEVGAWALLRSVRESAPEPQACRHVLTSLDAGLVRTETLGGAEASNGRARDAALRLLFGQRTPRPGLLAVWPLPPFVRAVLEDEVGRVEAEETGTFRLATAATAQAVAGLVNEVSSAAEALDRAAALDANESAAGLDALLASGTAALPLLLHEGRRAAVGVPPGRLDRSLKALAVLGLLRDRRATPCLIDALESPHGWVRAAAAVALGDLRDPAAAVALARQLAYAGDPFRARESWDYPGSTETDVPESEWPNVEYYVIDVAAADALLEMGARGAGAWLLRNVLDPRRRNLRVRVRQDACDALSRHLPADAPVAAYEVEAGWPQRERAYLALATWWRAHRRDDGLLRRGFDEEDAGFLETARALAERLGQPKVLELMLAKDVCELLGASLTPSLVAALSTARSPGHRAELAAALGRVDDPRAVPALVELLRHPQGFVRAKAAEALGAYAGRSASAVQALLAALDDADCGCRASAMASLAGAPRAPRVLAALHAHEPARQEAECGESPGYEMAYEVTHWMQDDAIHDDAHWARVAQGLRHADRVVRRSWWDLLRSALDLEERLFDFGPPPGSAGERPLPEAEVRAALRRRGGA